MALRPLWKQLRSDLARHQSLRQPGFWLLANYRFGRWANELPQPLRTMGSALYGTMLTVGEFLLGSTLHRETTVGEGLHLVHAHGIMVAPSAVLGDRVGIMQDVTIGNAAERSGTPVIGDDVFIGAGAKILGPVHIGARARIAANSLVISDVPADATAIGVPAKVVRYTGRPTQPQAAPSAVAAPEVCPASVPTGDSIRPGEAARSAAAPRR